MAKNANKTKANDASVEEFIATIENDKKRADSLVLMKLMQEATGHLPKMWGTSIIGYGSYHYKYDSGREGDFLQTGFSPRKKAISVYIMPGFKRYPELMEKLGKHKTGKSCLYINKLADVDLDVLRKLVSLSVQHISEIYEK